jgi:predicted metal-binding membrane protein
VPSALTVAVLSRRDRLLIAATVVIITALAWAYLVHLDQRMSADMEYDKAMAAMGMTTQMAWTVTDAWFAFAMWVVMMTGMMAPAAAPVLMLFAAAQLKRGGRTPWPPIGIFALGYAVAWTGFSAGAVFAQWILQRASMLTGAMAAAGPRLAGAILILAGIYQLTPWKNRCLSHCRSPLGFLMTSWRHGNLGSFKMGLRHGIYCLGCCWALMCVLFVVGVMNLFWIAALTGFVMLEKVGPAGEVIARIAGAAMIVLGAGEIVMMR